VSEQSSAEPDRIDGAPHPRDVEALFGHEGAEAAFMDAFNQDRLHHAWLLTGRQGIGKATLAWRIARFLLATPAVNDTGFFGDAPADKASLYVDLDHPVARRMRAGSEAGLFVLRRPLDEKTNRLKSVITVDEVRKLKNFFALSASEGGRRVVIVDAADEMNQSAANALLKVLEEPPAKTYLLLISHQPSRLLPTIRSRCRELRLQPLGTDELKAALHQVGTDTSTISDGLMALCAGSVGEAVRLANLDGLKLYQAILSVIETMPKFDRQKAQALAEMTNKRGAEDQRELLFSLVENILSRIARAGVMVASNEVVEGESQIFSRLSPTAAKARMWAETTQEITERNRHGLSVNLDPAALILDTVFRIQKTAEA
jgi:DNA polymerase-3 subunit delta'